MAQKRWSVVIVGILVSVIMLAERAYATSTMNRRRLVIFKQTIDLTTTVGYQTALSLVQASGSSVRYNLWFINVLAIDLPAVDIDGALSLLRSSLIVEDVSEDPKGSVGAITPSSAPALEDREWGVKRIKVPVGATGQGVKVAILDTGIDCNHPDLQVDDAYNVFTNGGLEDCGDNHGHGTHMAGTIQAMVNAQGLIGAAPGVSLVAVKVLNQDGVGYVSNFLRGMQWLYEQTDIRLANMSFGFWDNYPPLELAIERLCDRGVLMVAAAGNRCSADLPADEGGGSDGEGCDPSDVDATYPARHSCVISVGATDFYDQIAPYSRSGKIDVVAPGGSKETGIRILSTNRDGGYGYSSGTSAATAHVTGVLALVLEKRPTLSFEEAVELLATAKDLGYSVSEQGNGLIQADKMLAAVQ